MPAYRLRAKITSIVVSTSTGLPCTSWACSATDGRHLPRLVPASNVLRGRARRARFRRFRLAHVIGPCPPASPAERVLDRPAAPCAGSWLIGRRLDGCGRLALRKRKINGAFIEVFQVPVLVVEQNEAREEFFGPGAVVLLLRLDHVFGQFFQAGSGFVILADRS